MSENYENETKIVFHCAAEHQAPFSQVDLLAKHEHRKWHRQYRLTWIPFETRPKWIFIICPKWSTTACNEITHSAMSMERWKGSTWSKNVSIKMIIVRFIILFLFASLRTALGCVFKFKFISANSFYYSKFVVSFSYTVHFQVNLFWQQRWLYIIWRITFIVIILFWGFFFFRFCVGCACALYVLFGRWEIALILCGIGEP